MEPLLAALASAAASPVAAGPAALGGALAVLVAAALAWILKKLVLGGGGSTARRGEACIQAIGTHVPTHLAGGSYFLGIVSLCATAPRGWRGGPQPPRRPRAR
jgi:hypothetical protein